MSLDVTTKKWAPVLKKCKEYNESQWGTVAAVLENQFNAWCPGKDLYSEGLPDFVHFALPVTRRVLIQLFDKGFEIRVTDEKLPHEHVASVSRTELELSEKFVNAMDKNACLCDLISDQMVDSIEKKFPDKKIDLHLLMVVNAGPMKNAFGEGYISAQVRATE